MLTFKTQVEFRIGDIVYVKTDPTQARFIVTNYICNDRNVIYELGRGGETHTYYGFELTTEPDPLYKLESV